MELDSSIATEADQRRFGQLLECISDSKSAAHNYLRISFAVQNLNCAIGVIKSLKQEHENAASYKRSQDIKRNQLAEKAASDNLMRAKKILEATWASVERTLSPFPEGGYDLGGALETFSKHCSEQAEAFKAKGGSNHKSSAYFDNNFAEKLYRAAKKIADEATEGRFG